MGRLVDDELDITVNIYYQLCEGAPSSEDTSQCESMTDSICPELIANHDSIHSMRLVFMVPAMIQAGRCPMAMPSPYSR
jgi:hypothetical protein